LANGDFVVYLKFKAYRPVAAMHGEQKFALSSLHAVAK
jgi:hypothetical protein